MKKIIGFLLYSILVGTVSSTIGYMNGFNALPISRPVSVFIPKDPPDDPPGIVNINGESWLLQKQDMYGTLGFTTCETRTIFYNEVQHSKEDFRDTLWHEIIHAGSQCKDGQHITSDSKKGLPFWMADAQWDPRHIKVYEMAMFLTPFVHDNPEFMKWAEEWK